MAGTRVRLVNSAWPERKGCVGTVVVDPNGPGVYPCDKLDLDLMVVVLLDDDPLVSSAAIRKWSCVVSKKDVEVVSLPPLQGRLT